MIKVTYTYDKDRRECALLVKGHAGQAEIGKDIVCASASILAYTIAQVVKAMESHGDLVEPPTLDLGGGDTTIKCRAKDDYLFSEMMQYFFVAKAGYHLLAHNYPEYVQLITDDKA